MRLTPLTSILVLALAMTACSSASPLASRAPSDTASESRSAAPVPTMGAPVAPGARQADGGGVVGNPSGNSGQPPVLPSDQAVQAFRKIIYTGNLTLEAGDPLATAQKISALVMDMGGYVATSSSKQQGENMVANLSVRVPSEGYQDALTRIQGTADKVRDQKTTSQDVSEEYADLNAQLKNLEAAEAQYLEFLKRATTIDEVLKVQAQLTSVRGQIERIKGRVNFLDRRTDMATIDIAIYPPAISKISGSDISNPLEAAEAAWAASIRFLAAAASVAVSAVVFFWWAIPFVIALIILIRLRWNRRGRTPAAA